MGKIHLCLSTSFVAVLVASLSSAGNAQSVAPAEAEAQANEVGVEDIIVTARRREESLQNVPIAITALSPAKIEQAGLKSAEDLRSVVPALNVSGFRRDEAQFFVRGQGPGPQTTGQRNLTSVATYFAEVPATIAGPGVFYDLANVQILKGPQGTLFGRNTTGGAVLFEPAQPMYENNGYAKVSLGNYDLREFEAVVNVAPVSDRVALRVATQISRRDGYTTSAIGQKLDARNYEALRVSLRLNPTDTIQSTTIVDYRHKDGPGGGVIVTSLGPTINLGGTVGGNAGLSALAALAPLVGLTADQIRSTPLTVGGGVSIACLSAPASAIGGCPTPVAGLPASAGLPLAVLRQAFLGGGLALVAPTATLNQILATQQALGIRRNQVNTRLRSEALDIGVTNRTTIELTDTLTLKNVAAFRQNNKNEDFDYDGTALQQLSNFYTKKDDWASSLNQFTEEFQVQGRIPSAKLEYIVGGYYERVTTDAPQQIEGNTLGTYSDRISSIKDTSKAVFGHIEWNPSDTLGVSGGLRKTWDSRFVSFTLLTAAGACNQVDLQTNVITCPLRAGAKFNGLTYDATVNFKPSARTLLFGRYSRGYKSGGINLPTPLAPAPLAADAYKTFNPEKVDSFEIGFKGDFNIGIPLRTNASIFYDDYQNIQISQSVPTILPSGVVGAPQNIVRNAVRAKIKGIELEGTIVPVHALSLSGFFSYLDAAPSNTVPGVVVEGRQFQKQPKYKYGVSGAFTLPTSEAAGVIVASANWAWQSDSFNTNNPLVSLRPVDPSYGLLNARIDWTGMLGSKFDFALFATNALNKKYILGGYPIQQLGFDAALYGEPRMYGASLKVRFGE